MREPRNGAIRITPSISAGRRRATLRQPQPPSEMLARQLPAERVVTLPGGHDWETWLRLWRTLLAKGLFTVHA